jgi:hypothetical protein
MDLVSTRRADKRVIGLPFQTHGEAIISRTTKPDVFSAPVDDLVIDRVVQPVSDWLEEKIGVSHHRSKRFSRFFALLAFGFGISKYYRHNEIIFFAVLAFWLMAYFFLILVPLTRSKNDRVNLSFLRTNGLFLPINVKRVRHKKYRAILLAILLSSMAFSFLHGEIYNAWLICSFFLWISWCFDSCLSAKRKELIVAYS